MGLHRFPPSQTGWKYLIVNTAITGFLVRHWEIKKAKLPVAGFATRSPKVDQIINLKFSDQQPKMLLDYCIHIKPITEKKLSYPRCPPFTFNFNKTPYIK